MARFPLVDPAGVTHPLVKQTFQEIEQELGFGIVPKLFRSMATNPAILAANWKKFKSTILEGDVPRTVKEMLGVVVSHVNGSEYAKQVHLHSLSVQGVQELWLHQLTADTLDVGALPDSLAAMVRFAREAAQSPRQLSGEQFDALVAAGLRESEIFEIVATIDLFQSVNTYTDLAAVELDAI